MAATDGHIELERTVSSIQIGARHRHDLGDLDTLAASIDRYGLLQPITITPDGVLVCGARRLGAIRQLGWDTVRVWVRSGISDPLAHLLAEQDDNVLHKPLTQLEQATLYREITDLLREDAERRQEATRFSSEHQPGDDGPAKFAGPSESSGERRKQAADMIPGGASYATLDKVTWLQDTANDPGQPEQVRRQAELELEQIEQGAAVHPAWQRVRDLTTTAATSRSQDAARLAEEALAKLHAEQRTAGKRRSASSRPKAPVVEDREAWPPRTFVHTWQSFTPGWWDHFDVAVLVDKLTRTEIDEFFTFVDQATAFADQIRTALASPADVGQRPRLTAI
ncbi:MULTISPECIES: ParB N-terminal domain-containing protein [Propionibacteriaceae]|jgi:ParB family chromosome partitioning protein|uniref:Chromosome partitioning protein ParB n=3 Tax=Propionibacteriaceae TaxID=31957 RepID=A0A3Q9UMC5_9ACTN|nr:MULTISPECIES: ParB N-terminal domain-containing protein [Propionibacteriaceae]AMS06855.1 chromosome partitioning protein ParB [Acidipropionibacterium acidipropionici]AOZ45640.1 chromosome partitioning protein ParB [Acidipropionibacterium acidipropionici]AZP38347.1 chromosome partitioning protein ParB [Acidipropionibacterium acidipropionici]AZZ40372.1 chromosome partitioning protein ParB [Acidipropionibacterium jensenii]SER87609.1 chromosome partitioning protein, ParB family [Propionibacteri